MTKNEDKPNSSYLSKIFPTTNFFIVKKLWLFGMFSGDKGHNIDMCMVKIMIKANQTDMDVLLISKVDNIQKPKILLFPLFYWFVNFTLIDKHGTKNLSGLIHHWLVAVTR